MLQFDANLSFLFNELPFLERFAAAAKAGFRGVEYISPYEHPPEVIRDALRQNDLEQVLFNTPFGNGDRGERGTACLPGREADFRRELGQALSYAEALGCRRLHVMAGIVPKGAELAACDATFRANIRSGARLAAQAGVTLCLEPINQRDVPGFFLRGNAQALDIINDIGEPNVRLQFDVYHAQINAGDLSMNLRHFAPYIGHIQIANPPGRHEPGVGEIEYSQIFGVIEEISYDGWIGCEYKPSTTTLESLSWAQKFGIGQARP